MIFRPELVALIQAGKKTQTRRLVKAGAAMSTVAPLPVHGTDETIYVHKRQIRRFTAGRDEALQPGRGQRGEGRILITATRIEPVGAIDAAAARAEGFSTPAAFKAYWVELHDRAWVQRQADLREKDPEAFESDPLEQRVQARFAARHAHRHVWVIVFRLGQIEPPRLLLPTAGHLTGYQEDQDDPEAVLAFDEGYIGRSDRAMTDEPEAVDVLTQQAIQTRAGMTSEQWQTLERSRRDRDREMLAFEDRLVVAERLARVRNLDLNHIRNESRLARDLHARAQPAARVRATRVLERLELHIELERQIAVLRRDVDDALALAREHTTRPTIPR